MRSLFFALLLFVLVVVAKVKGRASDNLFKECFDSRNAVKTWVKGLGPGEHDPVLQDHFNKIGDAFEASQINEQQLFKLSWMDVKEIIQALTRWNSDVPPLGAAKTVMDAIQKQDNGTMLKEHFKLNFKCLLDALKGSWDVDLGEFDDWESNIIVRAWFELERWLEFARKSAFGSTFIVEEKERFEAWFGDDLSKGRKVFDVLTQLVDLTKYKLQFEWYDEYDGHMSSVDKSTNTLVLSLKEDFFYRTPETQVQVLIYLLGNALGRSTLPHCQFIEADMAKREARSPISHSSGGAGARVRSRRPELSCSHYMYYVSSFFVGQLSSDNVNHAHFQ